MMILMLLACNQKRWSWLYDSSMLDLKRNIKIYHLFLRHNGWKAVVLCGCRVGKNLGGVGGEETMVSIYFMKKGPIKKETYIDVPIAVGLMSSLNNSKCLPAFSPLVTAILTVMRFYSHSTNAENWWMFSCICQLYVLRIYFIFCFHLFIQLFVLYCLILVHVDIDICIIPLCRLIPTRT